MKPFTSSLVLSLFAAGSALALACVEPVALDARPCPCSDGWICCPDRNMCVAPGGTCGGSGVGGLGDGGLGGLNDAAPPEADPIVHADAQSTRCMTASGDYVYWVNADGLVVGAPRAGGPMQVSHFRTPLATNPRCGIALDGEELFTTSWSLGKVVILNTRSNGEWSIGTVGTVFGDLTTPSSLALDKDYVYVTEHDVGRVTRVPRTRAAAERLVEGLVKPHGIVESGDSLFFVERGDVDASLPGAIKRVAKSGGAVTTLATDLVYPSGLAAWDGRLFWTSAGKLWSVAFDGSTLREEARDAETAGPTPVTDGRFVYYSNRRLARIAPGGGGASEELDTTFPVALAIDEGRVFWADSTRVLSRSTRASR